MMQTHDLWITKLGALISNVSLNKVCVAMYIKSAL